MDDAKQSKPKDAPIANTHAAETNQTESLKPAYKADGYVNACKSLALNYVVRPLAESIAWLDGHNGLVTAVSTVAIAVLTYFVAVYANGQLGVFRSQLEEMHSTGKQTDDLIAANVKLSEAATKNAEAATASVAVLQNQLSVMKGQLDQMKSSAKQTDSLIETNKQLADAATKSAQYAEQSMKMAQRAELTVANFQFQNIAVGQSPIIKFSVGNIGKSSAYITSKPSIIAFVDAMPKAPDYPSNSTNISVTGNTNFVIDLDQPRPPPITQELFDLLKAGKAFILVYGRITYRDIFDDVWDVGYAMKYESVKDASGNMVFRDSVPETPGFTYLKKH